MELPRPQRLHPIRVLVAARDGDFLTAASSTLERAGFDVEVTEHLADLFARVGAGDGDVVVLDGSASVMRVARMLSALQAIGRAVGVVVVSDNPLAPRLDSFRPLPKWGSAERLVAQVERAYYGSDTRGEACLAVL